MNNYIVTFEYRVMVTAFAILAMFYTTSGCDGCDKYELCNDVVRTDCPPGDIVQEKAAAAVEHSHPSRKMILLQKVKVYNIVFGSIEFSS